MPTVPQKGIEKAARYGLRAVVPPVLQGGTDIATNLPLQGSLRAPEGSTVVTPLTTLVAAGGYAAYYNESRTHLSQNKDARFHRAIQCLGAVRSQPVLDRLNHRYCRI
jgi:hypothetical protein